MQADSSASRPPLRASVLGFFGAVSCLSLLASCQYEVEPVPEPEPWTLTAQVPISADGDSPLLCERGGGACRPLSPETPFVAPSVVKTHALAPVSVILGEKLSLDMSASTEASFEVQGERTVRLDKGTVTLQYAPQTADSAAPIRVLIHDRPLQLVAGPGSVSIRTKDDGFTVSVHGGSAAIGAASDRVVISSGRTVWVPTRGDVDRRAAWNGGLAPVESIRLPAPDSERGQPARGLGRMSARIPGTESVVSGVRLVSHDVRVVVRDGFARTEVVEEYHNETDRVLEGRYVFPLPARASISRLALWVGDKLVQGEVVDRERAARIFKGIVDDTVRPRDPALLEWVSGAEFSLKIFPIAPHKSRRVLLAYNEVLSTETGEAAYVYPLSLGEERATPIEKFSIQVDVEGASTNVRTPWHTTKIEASDDRAKVTFEAKDFVPRRDFVVRLGAEAKALSMHDSQPFVVDNEYMQLVPGSVDEGLTFALRVRATLPDGVDVPGAIDLRRVFVLDTSASQSRETLEAQKRLVLGLLRAMAPSEQFALLACDTDCVAYPASGFSKARPESLEGVAPWLNERVPRGASDIAESLLAATERIEDGAGGQLVYVGDGMATAGELDATEIAARVMGPLQSQRIDVRLIGVGSTIDEVLLGNLARQVGATYEALRSDVALDSRIETLAAHLRSPVVAAAKLELPDGFFEVFPRELPNLRLGEEIVVVGKCREGAAGTARLVGRLGGASYASETPIPWEGKAPYNPLLPRLWAEAKIASLESSDAPETHREIVRLSRAHGVMSRHTAMLVLENEQMFAEFGIDRTHRGSPAGLSTREGDSSADVGNVWGDPGDFGAGGLGLSGIGEGGGGRGAGIGHGVGFGSGAGRTGSARTHPPRVRMGATTVSGRLPPEVIQRIVRQNYGRFRACYERGLRRNPNLQGRVAIRFVIGRDGSVVSAANGGSDIPDAEVIQCVARSFQGLSFPQPEGGIVTVFYPIVFSSGSGSSTPTTQRPVAPVPTRPTSFDQSAVVMRAADDKWRDRGDKSLDTLRKALEKDSQSRLAHVRFVRGHLRFGRFDEALAAARKFAKLDPDLPAARELLAHAEAASGHASDAVAAIAWLVEGQPRSVRAQLRAAQAYEALGDQRRACAHWRAAAHLRDDGARYESIRCMARTLGHLDTAREMAADLESPSKDLKKLIATLEAGGNMPAYERSGGAGTFEAEIVCEGDSSECPTVVVVAPDGSVLSPWTPSRSRSSRRSVAFQAGLGTYRTLVAGGRPDLKAKLRLRAHNVVRTFDITGGQLRTVAATDIRRSRIW